MSTLGKAIKAVDPTPDKTKTITLALNLLMELAESKAKQAETEILDSFRTAGTSENYTIPITNILSWHTDTRAYLSQDASTIADVAFEIIDNILVGTKESVMHGMSKLIGSALDAILGTGTGIERRFKSYYIVTEGLSIVRFDISGWKRDIAVTGITQEIQSALSFQVCKSSVDIDKISFSTFLSAYNVVLEESAFTQEDLKKEIKEAKEIYNLLRTVPLEAEKSILASNTIAQVGKWIDSDTGKFLY
jgi:hypothetical protein